jgi:hypothetical protein
VLSRISNQGGLKPQEPEDCFGEKRNVCKVLGGGPEIKHLEDRGKYGRPKLNRCWVTVM